MRCQDIDAVIDEHRISALTAEQRAEVDAHLAVCARCFGAWRTNEMLTGEQIGRLPAGLFEATARRVGTRITAEPPRTTRPWHTAIRPAAAVLAATVVVVVLLTATLRRAVDPATDRPPESTPTLVEGLNYRVLRIPDAEPAAFDGNPVEVVEFFAYDCPPCYALARRMADWIPAHSADVALARIPVQWGERAARYARAFYAAEALGKAEEMQLAFYEEIQGQGNLLDDDDDMASFFARFGVDRPALESALDSQAVKANVARASDAAAAYEVTAVPTFVVGGNLVTTREAAQTPDRLLEIVEALVECVEDRRVASDRSQYC